MNAPAAIPVVHVVDHDETCRKAMSRLLRREGYEVRTYASAGEFALAFSNAVTGCLVIEVQLPGPSGLDVQAAIARSGNPLPIIFLTACGNVRTSVRAMKAGAIDYLMKPVERGELLNAVEAALRLEAAGRSRRDICQNCRNRYERLTPRERDIFARVTAGQPNKQIAAETRSALRTVKTHRSRVMEKMGATSLAELVHLADNLNLSPEQTAVRV